MPEELGYALAERSPARPFRHEAFLYSTQTEFVDGTTAFIREGLSRGEAVLTVVDADKIDRIRCALRGDADRVLFADMDRVGHNPALIIQAWRDFVSTRRDVAWGVRGIGEPISAARNDAALVECEIHESLLNVAFQREPNFWLLCPYDTATLPDGVVEHAVVNHPFVCDHDGDRVGGPGGVERALAFAGPLPPARGDVEGAAFDPATLQSLRKYVTTRGIEAGIRPDRVSDLVVAISEIATNAIMHGDGRGVADFWIDEEYFLCEVRGAGRVTNPLAGRIRPTAGQLHGYGLWLANQFCDLVQIRSDDRGTVVRLHVRRH